MTFDRKLILPVYKICQTVDIINFLMSSQLPYMLSRGYELFFVRFQTNNWEIDIFILQVMNKYFF